MKIKTLNLIAIASMAYLLPLQDALAHIAYRDIQTLTTPTLNPDGSTTYSLTSSFQGNGAWANGTDADWGNSHDILWYKFTVANPGGALVNLSLAGGITRVGPLVTLGDLTPAFTLYSGMLPPSSHDGAGVLPLPEGKDGQWLALADTTMANDAGEIGTIRYLGHGGEVDGTAQTVSLGLIFLAAGDYTVTPGGACYECFPHYERLDPTNPAYDPNYENQIIAIENDAGSRRGFNLSLNIQPVPVPAAVWLFGSALAAFVGMGKRKQRV